MKMNLRKIVPLVLIIAFVAFLVLMFQKKPISDADLNISATKQGEYVHIIGSVNKGSYKGYSYNISGENIMLTIQGSYLPTYGKNFEFNINQGGIKKIYLSSNNDEPAKLIWETSEKSENKPLNSFGDSEFKSIKN